jgi:hypothetical protein
MPAPAARSSPSLNSSARQTSSPARARTNTSRSSKSCARAA